MKMKIGKRMVLAIAVAIVVVTLIVYFVYPWYRSHAIEIITDRMIHEAQQRRVLLLCETDHQALLKAGREILSEEPVKERIQRIKNETPEGIKRGEGYFFVPKGVQMPQVIWDLRPHLVAIDNDGRYLFIEMHGGMDHFGVRIYPEGFSEPRPLFHGGRKLLEGLVYYDEGYSSNPEYDKIIEALLQKRK